MKATERFTGRSNNYTKYRPSYPAELFPYFKEELQWDSTKKIADIGAGTGIFTDLLLEQGYRVAAVEPNAEMRMQLQENLKPYIVPHSNTSLLHELQSEASSQLSNDSREYASRLTITDGQAESTGLAAAEVDGIVCAQSFHWFNAELARAEFMRVLVPNGIVVLLWNQRNEEASSFMRAYEALFLKYGEGYNQVKHKQMSVEALTNFYGGSPPHYVSFSYDQKLNRKALAGRIASSSFSPKEQDERYLSFVHDVDELYAQHEQSGSVTMQYRTDAYWGKLF